MKIKNIKTVKTDEMYNKEWTEVLSVKNRLLQLSDWTQLPDSGLTDNCVKNFMEWRTSLKKLRRSTATSIKNVIHTTNVLRDNSPPLEWSQHTLSTDKDEKITLTATEILVLLAKGGTTPKKNVFVQKLSKKMGLTVDQTIEYIDLEVEKILEKI